MSPRVGTRWTLPRVQGHADECGDWSHGLVEDGVAFGYVDGGELFHARRGPLVPFTIDLDAADFAVHVGQGVVVVGDEVVDHVAVVVQVDVGVEARIYT